MTDDSATANTSRTGQLLTAASPRCAGFRGPGPRLVLFVLLFSTLGARMLLAHDTIDIERANELVSAANEEVAAAKTAAGPGPEGMARFALGMILVEATNILNRDLAAHSGRLTVNAELLLKALVERDLAPRLDETIGRYRLPRAPLEEAIQLSPEAPYALRARFELLKAGFYESFVLDPFQLVGIVLDDLNHQIAEAKALAFALTSGDDAEEAAFIHALDLARASQLAPPEERHAYAGKARMALGAFSEAYPHSIRAATAGVIIKRLGGAE
jgi:hypothetical protein